MDFLKINQKKILFENFGEKGKVRNRAVVGDDRRIERFFPYWSNDK